MADMRTLTVGGIKFEIKDDDAVLFVEQTLTEEQKAQARANIGAAAIGETDGNGSGQNANEIPDYWEEHLAAKIPTIKKRQRESKDCYSFVVVTDYHCYGNKKHSPAMIKRIMDECGIKFCLCLGDIQNGGAWNTKELDLAEWDKIENEFSPIRDRTLMIPGNHDGAYGSADINGDGEIAGTTDYYIYNLSPAEVYDLILRKVGLISGVTFDASKNGYYVDDPVSKVRYILVNTHYSDGATNENGTAINNYMRKIRVGQPQQDMVITALQSIPGDEWTVVVGMHIPLAPMSDSGPSADMVILRDVLEAYQNKATYSSTYGTEGNYDYVSVNVDFTTAKGTVVGAFCGHIHQDDVNTEFDFPIIASLSDNVNSAKFDEVVVPGEAGTTTEQSFDVFTVNPRTGVIHATKIGYGSDRRFPETDYTNLADPASADWYNHAYLSSGTVVTDPDGVADQIVTNFIPVTQYDILRWKGLDNERVNMSGPGIQMFDENKEYIGSQNINEAGPNNTIYPVMTTDENGVTSYEILMRGSTGQQFVYNDWCTRTKYIRFSCCPLTTAADIIITVNEEIV